MHADQLWRVTMPAGAPPAEWIDAANDSAGRWNWPTGTLDRFNLFTGFGGDYPSAGSPLVGEWTITRTSNIDNDWPMAPADVGLTWTVFNHCPDGEVIGARIYVRDSVTTTEAPELASGTFARSALIHEMGHALGMTHEQERLSVMRATFPLPRVGIRSGISTGDNEPRNTESPWATDLEFAYLYHGTSNPGRMDMATSGWTWAFDAPSRHYGSSGDTISVCPGETVSLTYSVVNIGKKDATNVPVWIMLSDNDNISNSDILLRQTNASRSSTSWSEYERTFTVPEINFTPRFVGVIVDPLNAFAEDNEHNNSTITGLKIVRGSSCI